LASLGVSYWVDREKLRPGYIFHADIVAAIKGCRVLVLICSAASYQKDYVIREVLVAFDEHKALLPVLVEQVHPPPDELRIPLGGVQYVELFGRHWERRESLLLAAVRDLLPDRFRVSGEPSIGNAALRSVRADQSHSFRSLLVDRGVQRADIASELEARSNSKEAGPVIFLIHGSEDQCIDGFLERLRKFDIPKILRGMDRDDCLQWYDCAWPPRELPLEERTRCLRRELSDCLDLKAATWEGIHSHIVLGRIPHIFSFHIGAERWQPNDKVLLLHWSASLATLPSIDAPAMLIILISTKYPSMDRSILKRLLARARIERVRKAVETIPTELPAPLTGRTVRELESIPQADAEQWAREVARPHDIVGMIRDIRAFYTDRTLAQDRCIAMEPLALRLRTLLEAYGEAQRV
jgi:hypothetical protein